MQSGSKSFGRKLVETVPNVEMKAKEQQDSDRKVQESLDNLIRQTIGREPFLSFTRTGDSPVQWIQWLDSWDQQNASKASKGLKVDVGVDMKDNRQAENLGSESTVSDVNGVKDSVHSSMKSSGVFGRGLQASGERMHSLKIPEAVVAFAQAAAKANGLVTDLPGWPLMSPSKAPLQKCEKCAREFCSPLNYRRHIRMHRRPLNVDKEDLRKVRPQVAAFWDKLTGDEAAHIVSFKNIMLEDLSGASAVKALASFIQQPGAPFFHQSYLKAGAALLDIVQNKASKFPLSSEALFSVLDDSSEKTFLCGVLSVSMQRFIFEGEAGKVGLEARNLVASLGFLVEQRLVKAWMADRDAEALRCQKALVEEEEAAQKKQAKLQERKRLKKIRQKELKEKERKGNESGFRVLDIVSLDGGNRPRHGEGCDSPSATQSNSSSSGFSGQDHLMESSTMDIDEFEGYSSGRIDNMFFRLADEESLQGADEQQEAGWTKIDSEGTVGSMGCRTEGEVEVDHTSTNGQSGMIQTSSRGEIQEATEMQYHHSNEDRKIFMEFKTRAAVRFASERKVGCGWRERKRYDSNEFSSYQRPLYGGDRRFFDGNPHQAQRTIQKPYNVAGSTVHEYSAAVPSVTKPFAVPRYGQYRDRALGVRRSAATAVGNTHVVWTRKVLQNPVPQSDKLDKPDVASKSVNAEDSRGAISMSGENQMEDERRFTGHDHRHDIGGLMEKVSCGNSCDSSFWAAYPDKSDRISGHDNPHRCLSRDSSLSLDSVSSQSSVSISAKVGVEEQAQHEEIAIQGHEIDEEESSCLSWQFTEDQPEVTSSSGALFIGSLSIPLEVFSHPKCEKSSHEKLKRVSRDIQHLPGKKQKGEAADCQGLTSPSEVARKTTGSECKVVASACDISDELKVNHSVLQSRQVAAGEGAEGSRQTNVGHDKITKQGSLPNGVNRAGSVKVWRPVGVVGERHEVSTNGFGPPSGGEVDLSHVPFNSNTTQDDSSSICSSELEGDIGLATSSLSTNDSTVDQQKHEMEARISDERQVPGTRICSSSGPTVKHEAFETLSKVDIEKDGAVEDWFNFKKSTGELHAAEGWECEHWGPLIEYVANFLSQRWADAVATYDSPATSDGTESSKQGQVHAGLCCPSSQICKSSDSELSLDELCSSSRTSDSEQGLGCSREICSEVESLGVEEHSPCCVTDSDWSSTGDAIPMQTVPASEKQEVVLASAKTKSDRWHWSLRASVPEPKYIPRRTDMDEKN